MEKETELGSLENFDHLEKSTVSKMTKQPKLTSSNSNSLISMTSSCLLHSSSSSTSKDNKPSGRQPRNYNSLLPHTNGNVSSKTCSQSQYFSHRYAHFIAIFELLLLVIACLPSKVDTTGVHLLLNDQVAGELQNYRHRSELLSTGNPEALKLAENGAHLPPRERPSMGRKAAGLSFKRKHFLGKPRSTSTKRHRKQLWEHFRSQIKHQNPASQTSVGDTQNPPYAQKQESYHSMPAGHQPKPSLSKMTKSQIILKKPPSQLLQKKADFLAASSGKNGNAKPWTAHTFPFIGSQECAQDYHQSHPAEQFLCDPDNLLGHSSAQMITDELEDWWDFCHHQLSPSSSFHNAADSSYNPYYFTADSKAFSNSKPGDGQRWKFALGAARALSSSSNDMNGGRRQRYGGPSSSASWPRGTGATGPYYRSSSDDGTTSTDDDDCDTLETIADRIRLRWTRHTECRIDLLILVSQQSILPCDLRYRDDPPVAVTISLSPAFRRFLTRGGGGGHDRPFYHKNSSVTPTGGWTDPFPPSTSSYLDHKSTLVPSSSPSFKGNTDYNDNNINGPMNSNNNNNNRRLLPLPTQPVAAIEPLENVSSNHEYQLVRLIRAALKEYQRAYHLQHLLGRSRNGGNDDPVRRNDRKPPYYYNAAGGYRSRSRYGRPSRYNGGRVRSSLTPPGGSTVKHTIPSWAWASFIVCITLSLGCAYFGHGINQSGSAFSMGGGRNGPGSNRQWGAGFGGGMLEMRPGAGGPGPGGGSARKGLMAGMMGRPKAKMNTASMNNSGARGLF